MCTVLRRRNKLSSNDSDGRTNPCVIDDGVKETNTCLIGILSLEVALRSVLVRPVNASGSKLQRRCLGLNALLCWLGSLDPEADSSLMSQYARRGAFLRLDVLLPSAATRMGGPVFRKPCSSA